MNTTALIRLILAFLISISLFSCGKSDKKNHIIILDTSMSMSGFGGKNILGNVKQGIENYINKVKDGDKVTFLTFDSKVKVYPTVHVQDENDRDILKKYISMIEAKGKWTYMYHMLRNTFDAADKLEKDSDRQTVIVILTDGLDDPPPGSDKLNFQKLVKKYQKQGQNWWLYLISFSELQKDADLQKKRAQILARNRFKKNLQKISKKTKFIDASADPKKGIDTDLTTDIKQEDSKRSSNLLFIILIIILVIAVGGAVYFFVIHNRVGKVEGLLEYWNNSLLEPYVEHYDLGRRQESLISIGNTVGVLLNIQDLEVNGPVIIKAVKGGTLEIHATKDDQVEFINKEASNQLVNGDIFKLNNYTFKYNAPGQPIEQ